MNRRQFITAAASAATLAAAGTKYDLIIKGGRVIGEWPGLNGETLEGPGDLPVINNYRNVLAPVLAKQGAAAKLDDIFPDFPLQPIGLYA